MTDIDRLIGALAVLIVYAVICWFYLLRSHRPPTQASALKPHDEQDNDLTDLLIAYASQSGRAAALAKQSAAMLRGQKHCRVVELNQVDSSLLAHTKEVLFVVSTYGEGEAPDNGRLFAKRFFDESVVHDLSHLQFSVIALGDRVYQQFCAFGHQLYQGLLKLGAMPLLEPLELCAQEQNSFTQALELWRMGLGLNSDTAHENLQSVNVNAISQVSDKYGQWVLAKRQLLNAGSPGAETYLVTLVPANKREYSWQAGDLIELNLTQSELNSRDINNQSEVNIRRKYSIASLPEQGVIELVVRQHISQDGRIGIGSGWLTKEAELNVSATLQILDNPLFHSIESERPMILIGSGTGIAGLRAHLKHRIAQGAKENWLLFGERSPLFDRLFEDEINCWQEQGELYQVDWAFSRDDKQPQYVQDVLKSNVKQLEHWLARGAAIYVCGNRLGMAEGVDQCLQQALDATVYNKLLSNGLYRRDVY